MARKKQTIKQRWVIKVGSNIVCTGGILLIKAWAQQLITLRDRYQIEVVWVTSGAIASAVERTGFSKRDLPEKQALSAIGQPILMDLYNLALQTSGLLGSQILLTSDDLKDKTRAQNFKNTLEKLLLWKVIPILNENDAIANEEIKFGDNDALSAQVAANVGANRLVILTDVDGLYDSDPRKNKNAKSVRKVSSISPKLLRSANRQSGSDRGTGGMYSKLKAAQTALNSGIPTWLVRGDTPQILVQVAEDRAVGTRIGLPNGALAGAHTRKTK